MKEIKTAPPDRKMGSAVVHLFQRKFVRLMFPERWCTPWLPLERVITKSAAMVIERHNTFTATENRPSVGGASAVDAYFTCGLHMIAIELLAHGHHPLL